MKKTVAIGKQNFASIIEENCFYIDKTSFLKEWWESKDDTTLIARPRRFGKTLNISMTEYFFSNKYAGRGDLFGGLSVWQEEKYRQLQGTYPVISLSFARVKEEDFESSYNKISEIIREQYVHCNFLLQSEKLTETEKDFMNRILHNGCEKAGDMTSSLYQLCSFLYRYYENCNSPRTFRVDVQKIAVTK